VELELVTGAHVLDALLDALPNPSRSPHAVTLKSDHALT
jgi:hypothetical protein